MTLPRAAMAYAKRGWPVLPLKPGQKVPATRNGLHDASTDPDQIRAWWTENKAYNVGLRTGIAFDVLDLDGPDALDELDKGGANATGEEFCGQIAGPIVLTGGGVHIYCRPTGLGNAAGLLPGIDWRGVGGYVVAPPSVHPNGRIYEWAVSYPIDTPLAVVPDWLRGLMTKPVGQTVGFYTGNNTGTPYGVKALEGELGRLAIASEGTRNDVLVRAAFRVGQLVASGDLEALDAAQRLLAVALRTGLGQTEAERTIESGMDAGHREPRRPR